MINSEKLIIWDWNGTLLDDVEYCKDKINEVLNKYKLPELSLEHYRNIFCFPVRDYYKKIGFDFSINPFEVVGAEFIERYNKDLAKCNLSNNAHKILSFLKSENIKQVIISARESESLNKDLENYEIKQYIDEFYGIDNIYATSKEHLFENVINNGILKENIYLIGDTTHDCEIAKKLGINFILYQNGHQSSIHFEKCADYTIISDLAELKKIF